MERDIFFEVKTINGLIVRTTYDYWGKIITFKHPSMAGMEEDVKAALEQPDEIRKSIQSENVLLYYHKWHEYHVCVVVRVLNGDGFIITSYITDRIKEGRRIWKK